MTKEDLKGKDEELFPEAEEKEGKKESSKDSKESKESPKESESKDSKALYALIGAGAIVVILGLLTVLPGTDDNTGVFDAAVTQSAELIGIAAQNNISILTEQGSIEAKDDGYLVSFPVEGGDIETFDVKLDEDKKLQMMGFNGELTSEANFLNLLSGPNEFQHCAKIFNEQDVIPKLINARLNGSSHTRYIMTLPRVLNCNGEDYGYSLELGDGYVKTTLNGYFLTNNFNKGIVVDGVSISEEDTGKGVFLYVDRVGYNQFAYSYEVRDESPLDFDGYSPGLVSRYNIQSVPRVVWNCKFALTGTLVTAELNGSIEQGTEETMLKTMSCLYNAGMPQDICEPLGIRRSENGTITTSIDVENFFKMYETGEASCKPDDETTLLQVFHGPGDRGSVNQRRILEKVSEDFGDYLDVEYYCVGEKDTCKSLVSAD